MPQELPAHTATAKTHHITDPHHAGISPKMTVDPEHINLANTITNPHKGHLPVHNQHSGSLRIESTNRLQLNNPASEYYSSDEQDSDSEDALN